MSNKNILSNKSVLLTATTFMAAMMLVASVTGGISPALAEKLVETSTEVGTNVDTNTNVILNEEDCKEAKNGRTSQENTQSTDQKDGTLVQQALQVGINVHVGVDVVLVPCDVSSETSQENDQSISQEDGTFQRADIVGHNIDAQVGANADISEFL